MFKDLLDEMKSFKFEIAVKVLLRKHKVNGNIEYALAYFNSTTTKVINLVYMLYKSFQEILYRIDNRINEWSDWLVQSANAEYVKISVYSPLPGRVHTINCLVN